MGISLHLSILPDRIAPRAWEAAWDESLALLERFPLGLLANAAQRVGAATRIVRTRRIERSAEDPKERHWHVLGDATTLRLAESFLVYRSPARYYIRGGGGDGARDGGEVGAGASAKPEEPAGAKGRDIVIEIAREQVEWEELGAGTVPPLASRSVFGEKTQGEPYHEAILAVGMLFEARFPGAAAVHGDFVLADAKDAQRFAREALGWDLPLPVMTAPALLADRLAPWFEGERLVEAVLAVSCEGGLGPSGNAAPLVALVGTGRKEEARRWLARELRQWDATPDVDATMDVVAWLNATGDVATLCEICCVDPKGPGRTVLELAKLLLSSGVTGRGSPPQQESQITPPAGVAPGIHALLLSFLRDVQDPARHLTFRIDEDVLVSELCRHFPEAREALSELVRAQAAKAELAADAPRPAVGEMAADRDSGATEGDWPLHAGRLRRIPSLGALSPDVQKALAAMAGAAWRAIQAIRNNPRSAPVLTQPLATIRELLAEASYRNYVCLTEEAWQRIDAEEDVRVLRFLMGLLSLRLDVLPLPELRLGILENTALCRELAYLDAPVP